MVTKWRGAKTKLLLGVIHIVYFVWSPLFTSCDPHFLYFVWSSLSTSCDPYSLLRVIPSHWHTKHPLRKQPNQNLALQTYHLSLSFPTSRLRISSCSDEDIDDFYTEAAELVGKLLKNRFCVNSDHGVSPRNFSNGISYGYLGILHRNWWATFQSFLRKLLNGWVIFGNNWKRTSWTSYLTVTFQQTTQIKWTGHPGLPQWINLMCYCPVMSDFSKNIDG